jgi:hypothetical protein
MVEGVCCGIGSGALREGCELAAERAILIEERWR